MATPSEVKAGLDDIAATIRTERQALKNSAARIATALANLNSIPTTFAALITEIDGYAPSGAFETLAKDEKAKLAAEFMSLKSKAQAAKADLDAIDFST